MVTSNNLGILYLYTHRSLPGLTKIGMSKRENLLQHPVRDASLGSKAIYAFTPASRQGCNQNIIEQVASLRDAVSDVINHSTERTSLTGFNPLKIDMTAQENTDKRNIYQIAELHKKRTCKNFVQIRKENSLRHPVRDASLSSKAIYEFTPASHLGCNQNNIN